MTNDAPQNDVAEARPGKKKAGLVVTALFATAVGTVAVATAPEFVPEMIDAGWEETAKATVSVLPTKHWQRAAGLEAALMNNRFELAEFFINEGGDGRHVYRQLRDGLYNMRGEEIDADTFDVYRAKRLLLEKGGLTADADFMHFVIMDAVYYEDLAELSLLADAGAQIGEAALVTAAGEYRNTTLDYLLDKISFDEAARGKALRAAIIRYNADAFERLVDSGPFSQESLNKALIAAADADNTIILDRLLKSHEFDAATLKQAFAASLYDGKIRNSYIHLVKSRLISERDQMDVIAKALDNPDYNYARTLTDRLRSLQNRGMPMPPSGPPPVIR